MKNLTLKLAAFLSLFVFSAPFLSLQAQEKSAENKENEKADFSAYMESIGVLQKSIQDKLGTYQEASKKLFPKQKEGSEATIIVLSTYEKQFVGSFIPYYFREYVEINGGSFKLFSEKTVTDTVVEGGESLDPKAAEDKSTPYTRQREIEVSGSDAESIKIVYRSTTGSLSEKTLGELKNLRSKIEILNQIREQLSMAERVMDYTIRRSELLQETLTEKTLVDFGTSR